jgi:hypothetical protein
MMIMMIIFLGTYIRHGSTANRLCINLPPFKSQLSRACNCGWLNVDNTFVPSILFPSHICIVLASQARTLECIAVVDSTRLPDVDEQQIGQASLFMHLHPPNYESTIV